MNTHRMLHRAWEDFAVWGWAKRNVVADAHPLGSRARAGRSGVSLGDGRHGAELRLRAAGLPRLLVRRGLCRGGPSHAALAVQRRRSSLPRGLARSEIQAILNSCDRRSALGRRDYAIVILLVRLGLRRAEVAALRLDDIDWRAGELVVRGKRSRAGRLPLPLDVGRAVTAYLQGGRPSSPRWEVFLTGRAPLGPVASGTVAFTVRRACRSCPVHLVAAATCAVAAERSAAGYFCTTCTWYSMRMARQTAIERISELLDDGELETSNTSMRIPTALRDAAALAVKELGIAPSATALTTAALRATLEAVVMQAALDDHYERYPRARPDLGDLAIAAAELDGHPLAAQPGRLRQAAAEIAANHPGASPGDVLLWAEARALPAA